MPSLSSHLASYVDLGFDSDDLNALVDAIDGNSRASSQSTLPHLPAELLLQVVEHVPIDHVLQFRSVCKGFRDYIDTRVLYSYIRRTELLAYLGTDLPTFLNDRDRERLEWIYARFSHLQEAAGFEEERKAKWDTTYAVFKLDDDWFETATHKLNPRQAEAVKNVLLAFSLNFTPGSFDKLDWCIKLDHGVLDVDLGKANMGKPRLWLDLDKRTVNVEWRTMLFNFLKSETAIRKKFEDTVQSEYNFGHLEDCLRAIRRQRARTLLDLDDRDDALLLWQLRSLPALFQKPSGSRKADERYALDGEEDRTVQWLLQWRREARLTKAERDLRIQLAQDREALFEELTSMNMYMAAYQMHFYDQATESQSFQQIVLDKSSTPPFAALHYNPLFWSDETMAIEQRRVGMWKIAKKNSTNAKEELKAANEAMDIPEDAFDDLDSEI